MRLDTLHQDNNSMTTLKDAMDLFEADFQKKATEALEETKRVYIHNPDDAKLLQTTADTIEEENEALQMREKAFYSDDDSDEAGY
ncbi:hypothetical protein J4E89_010069 [Alternaria sp. Ai002NY15]|nr:hypothetical protein J4E89_010069 [Alternaria sp. Ai002NY15]